ncbi:MAG: cupin domain-containing protein [Oscillospiraceae bacterium]|nr:cupin domain-containing protein [Oscillospiraceae bacterium]
MPIKNFYETEYITAPNHGGEGLARMSSVYRRAELDSPLSFINYTVLPPGASIGIHTHRDDEEVYVILEGTGIMEVDGAKIPVKAGDTVLNKPFGSHALYNGPGGDMRVLIFEAAKRNI